MKTATKTAQPDLTTFGELKSHKWDDVRFRIGKCDEVAESCREWYRALIQEKHPASLTLMAAASMIGDLAETIMHEEQEIASWKNIANTAITAARSERDAVKEELLFELERLHCMVWKDIPPGINKCCSEVIAKAKET
jgi:hypothetical protein